AASGAEAIGWFGQIDIALDPPGPRLGRSWSLREAMSSYDAAYAAMAEALGRPLLSVDGRLLRACRRAGIASMHLDELARPPSDTGHR
ncbi:MAG: hypothetical protein ACRDV8_10915, partial [Acidimicrobiales bacterium]